MKQVVQAASGGEVALVDAPVPEISTTQVLVQTEATLISAGTERSLTKLARSSLLEKARARPDLVQQVLEKARSDGLRATAQTVRTRLADDVPLGYSGAGTVIEVGSAVRGIRAGMRVATGGAGFANHAEFQAVPHLLCSQLEAGADAGEAAFATVASVGLHGLRQASVGVGSRVVVVGLGLIGQLTARLAVAAGCDVAGIDVREAALAMAKEQGILGLIESGTDTTAAVMDWSRGLGADAVIITAGGRGDSSIMSVTPERCRDRATIVAVGEIGLDLDRRKFYDKELQLRLARSYGPGRYERSYEEWGVDIPAGHLRWTEGRNIEAVAAMVGSGRIHVDDLITHRFDISEAAEAYRVLDDPKQAPVGILLDYDTPQRDHSVRVPRRQRVKLGKRTPSTGPGVGILGAGQFVRTTILPSLRKAGFDSLVHISSASGSTAARLAERNRIPRASTGIEQLLVDDAVDLVVVATPHSVHAEHIVAALDHGKHVYAEKPLALSESELASVNDALNRSTGVLYAGFNRRWSPMVAESVRCLANGSGPLAIDYRVNAGPLAPSHWYSDRREGGRLRGEVCHFVDTANAIIGSTPTQVTCMGPNVDIHDSYALLIGYEDGSSAAITYVADASASTPKERCEVLGRGQTILIDDFSRLTIDGTKADVPAGKGHVEGLSMLRSKMVDNGELDSSTALVATAVTLAAARSLATQSTVLIT